MGRRWGFLICLALLLAVPAGEADAISLTVDTSVPEYILDDFLNLTGTTSGTSFSWLEDTSSHFSGGTPRNLTVADGSLHLKPSLDITIQNGGNAVFTGAGGTAWDKDLVVYYDVIKHKGTYYMVYSAGTAGLMNIRHLGMAKSPDGINWTRYSNNPILMSRVDSYDYTNLLAPVLMVNNGTWHIWYAGNKGNTNPAAHQDITVCYANSTDGVNFTKYSGNPVLPHGSPNTAWDGTDVRSRAIIDEGGTLRMYYTGTGQTWGGSNSLAFATSQDGGLTWSEYDSNPCITKGPAAWYKDHQQYGSLEKANGTYRLWASGDNTHWKIGWVRSDDGKSWKDAGGPLLSPAGGTIYAGGVFIPRVIDEGDHYKLYATCIDVNGVQRIGLFKATPQKLDGNYTSRVYDAQGVSSITGVEWNSTLPSGARMDLYLRWANFSGAWSSWTRLEAASLPTGVSARYFQYRAELDVARDWMEASFDRFKLSLFSQVHRVEASVDGGNWQSVSGDLDEWYVNVSLHDGDYDVTVMAMDTRGTEAVRTIPVKVDLFPPVGNITIEEGRDYHDSSDVLLEITASDTHGPIQMQLSRQPTFPGATWMDLRPRDTWRLLGDPEGEVTIYVRFRDDAGRVSATYNDSIIIDQNPPEGALLIDGGAKYTRDLNVSLAISWTDLTGVVAMMVSNDPDFEGAEWMDPVRAMQWTIGEADGLQHVHVRLRDVVGWTTDLEDSIILDRTAPAATLSIDDDAPFTTSRDVELDLTLHDDSPVLVKLANVGDPWPDAWRNLTTPIEVPWILGAGMDGLREVRMLVRDAAGNEVMVSDDIVMDTTPPEGTVTINGGARFTRDLLVTLGIDASDATSGLDRMRVAASDDLSGAPWETVVERVDWVLEAGDGTKRVYVELRDRAGLTATIDTSIILDTTPPEGSFIIGSGDEFCFETAVELHMDFTDAYGLSDLRVSNSPNLGGSGWMAYSSLVPWELPEEEGERTVHVEVQDAAGNSVVASASIVLDLFDPSVSLVIAGGTEGTLETIVTAEWNASDSLGLRALRWSTGADPSGVTWEPMDPDGLLEARGTLAIDLRAGDNRLNLQVMDMAGRVASASDAIVHVPERPRGELRIEGGANWTNGTVVGVTVTWTGGHGAHLMRVATSREALEAVEWNPFSGEATLPVPLSGDGGAKEVWAQLMGLYSIPSEPFGSSITLDVLEPVVQVVSPVVTETEEDSLMLELVVSDDQDASPSLMYRLNGGEWTPYSGPVELRLVEGDNTIEVEARDEAGNVAEVEHAVHLEPEVDVGGTDVNQWLVALLVVIVLSVSLALLWLLYIRRRLGEE